MSLLRRVDLAFPIPYNGIPELLFISTPFSPVALWMILIQLMVHAASLAAGTLRERFRAKPTDDVRRHPLAIYR